ncbi:MAG: peptidyl-prolyl cis-trans isomerase [Rubrivivax sp.]|nr:peptidyl-prolyl cis-trans isomerase [Rubrivivax sp.]
MLGALLFAIDHAVVARSSDPRTIVVGAEVDEEAKRLFTAARGREPNDAELAALRQRWIDNEVLYREGLALGVDRGAAAIRERVIFKSLSVVSAHVKPPTIDDDALRAWFESKRAQYDEPARYDFQEAVVAGERSEDVVRRFVLALNAGTAPDVEAGLRVFKGRPHESIVQSYGAEFADALEAGPAGEWRALPTRDGWRAVRLDAVTPAKPANYEALRGVVLQDWTDAVMAERRTAAVRALAAKYKVRFEVAEP